MLLSYKYRIYPKRDVEVKLIDAIEICRWLYNKLLEEIKKSKNTAKPLGMYDCHKLIRVFKEGDYPELKKVYSRALQMVSTTLWSNIRSLSKLKKKGYRIGSIRFKGPGWYKTINYNQGGFKVNGDILTLFKIGDMKINLHRPIDGKIRGVIIKHEESKWYAIFQLDVQDKPLPPNDNQVGIDVGIKSFAVDSDSNNIENPKYLDKKMARIKLMQKKLSRKKKGSNNRIKARAKLAKMHLKVFNQRRDFLHKLSRYYVNNYGTICIEKLDIINLKESRSGKTMRRNIHSAAWDTFALMLSYKAESAGRKLIKVDPKNTTNKCSNCGGIVEKTLAERIHKCPYCGYEADRDYNAARNILIAGVGYAEVFAEPRPLLNLNVEQALTMKQKAPAC